MENPPNTSGHRRPMSETCDVIINDVEDGVILVVEHRDPKPYTMRFDFGTSENLMMEVPTDGEVEKAGDMKCNIQIKGKAINLCHLKIADRETKSSFEMRYRVQCLVRNEKTGELEQVKPPSGGPSAEEKREEITETLTLITQRANDGYILYFENSEDSKEYKIKMDFTKSENLALNLGPKTNQESEMIASFALPAKSREPFVKMSIVDRSKGSCALDYIISHSRLGDAPASPTHADPANLEDDKKKADEEAAKKKADEEAAKKKADEEAAKKKADEEAAKKKADEEAAKKKADEEAAKKKAEEEAAKKMNELLEEQRKWRIKIEAEWKVRWTFIQKTWLESVCAICRKPFAKGVPTKGYKGYLLHEECYDKAPKCDYCGEILVGEYVESKGDGTKPGVKLHKECIEGYKSKTRPVCYICGKQILDSKWHTTSDGKAYHISCKPE